MGKKFKVILAGDGRVGKTTLRKQYLGDNLKKDYMMTIGADFAVKRVEIGDVAVTLQIWDLAGQPKFSAIRDKYYHNSDGALFMFDLSNRQSFENIPNWIDEFMKNTNNSLKPMLLIGNKADLIEKNLGTVTDEEVEVYLDNLNEWAKQYDYDLEINYLKTSALYDTNVEKAFEDLLQLMIDKSDEIDV